MPGVAVFPRVFSLVALLGAVTAPLGHEALAAPPSFSLDGHGAYHITFSSPAVYDLTTQYTKGGEDGLTLSLALLHHASGHLVGEGRDFGGAFDVRHEIKGTVRASRGVTIVKETVHSVGSIDTPDPEQYRAVTKKSGTIEGDAYDAKYTGTITTKFCMKMFDPILEKTDKICVRHEIPQEVDHSGDGIWTLKLNPLARFGNELFGTATIFVDDGSGGGERSADAEVSGKVARGGLATLKIKTVGEDALGTVTLKAFVSGGEAGEAPTLVSIYSVKGKLLGQSFNEGY